MALPSAYNEISINTIYNHIGAASNYGYEGGYALRALSLHGRYTLNDSIFDQEDRLSDFYSKDFSNTSNYRLRGGIRTGVFSEDIDPVDICNDNFLINSTYYTAASEELRFASGQSFTVFDNATLQRVIANQAYRDFLGRVWWINGSGIAQLVIADCSKFAAECDSPYNYYWAAMDCGTGEYIGVVHTNCFLRQQRVYQIDTRQRLPIEFSGYQTVMIAMSVECEPGGEYAVISDCGSKICQLTEGPKK
jgi:hypothetical protein